MWLGLILKSNIQLRVFLWIRPATCHLISGCILNGISCFETHYFKKRFTGSHRGEFPYSLIGYVNVFRLSFNLDKLFRFRARISRYFWSWWKLKKQRFYSLHQVLFYKDPIYFLFALKCKSLRLPTCFGYFRDWLGLLYSGHAIVQFQRNAVCVKLSTGYGTKNSTVIFLSFDLEKFSHLKLIWFSYSRANRQLSNCLS